LVDADVQPGHAYVEVGGARIDVGTEARKALVFSALGLNPGNSPTASLPSAALAIDPPLLEDKVNEPPAL
jgi:hypothetical protein